MKKWHGSGIQWHQCQQAAYGVSGSAAAWRKYQRNIKRHRSGEWRKRGVSWRKRSEMAWQRGDRRQK